MYRVMIVDDEPIIRKGLINFIQWDSLHCQIVCQAEDGIEAVEQLKSASPDIIITDIKMPGMDGIELTKHIYEHYPDIKVIMLTGHADFSYAQSAIKYGVADFVLKPTSTEKILEAVTKAKKLIAQAREKEAKIRTLEEKVTRNLAEMQDKCIRDILHGIISDKETIKTKMKVLDIQLDHYYVLLSEIKNYEKTVMNANTASNENYITTLNNVFSVAFKNFKHYNTVMNNKLLCTLVSFNRKDCSECIKDIITTCEEVQDMIESFMKFDVSIGISSLQHDISHIATGYKEAQDALSYQFYNESNIFIYMPRSCEQTENGELSAIKQIDRIFSSVNSNNADEALQMFHQWMEEQKKKKQPIEFIKNAGILLCSLCLKQLPNHHYDLSKVMENAENLYSQILQSKSFDQLNQLLSSVIKSTVDFMTSSDAQSNHIIRKTQEYIEENYDKNIRLPLIAQYVHVNGSYLSRLYRKETGETLTEAITRVRMEKAKELLILTNLKTYEIASMVGIEDAAYFSQLFKKYTGMNPTDYKHLQSDKK